MKLNRQILLFVLVLDVLMGTMAYHFRNLVMILACSVMLLTTVQAYRKRNREDIALDTRAGAVVQPLMWVVIGACIVMSYFATLLPVYRGF